MPFVQVKCPACGGEIQLDDSRDFGFCVYCGAKVMLKDTIQKMELSGEISVRGVVDFEKLSNNFQAFNKMKNYKQCSEVIQRLLKEYPENWRSWWLIAALRVEQPIQSILDEVKLNLRPDRLINVYQFAFCIREAFIPDNAELKALIPKFYNELNNSLLVSCCPHIEHTNPFLYIENALMFTPPEETIRIKEKVIIWLQQYIENV